MTKEQISATLRRDDLSGLQALARHVIMEPGDIMVSQGQIDGPIADHYIGQRVDEVFGDDRWSVYRKIPVPKNIHDATNPDPVEYTLLPLCTICREPIHGKQKSAKYCSKKCKHRAGKIAEMKRYHSNPEDRQRHLDRSKAYARANPERNRARVKSWRLANPEKHRLSSRLSQGMINPTGERKYGPCEACGNIVMLELDHDHKTGLVRGWLCGPCNRALGQAKDSAHILQSLFNYIIRFK